jgi:uroporphyrinogen decarboxylase
MISHRDRVMTALEHKKTDRVPLDLGGTQTSILVEPYNALKKSLGINTHTHISNILLGLAEIDEQILNRFDIDFRHVLPKQSNDFKFELNQDDSFFDEFGTLWKRPSGGYYYDMVDFPLKSCSLEDLSKFKWPNPLDNGRIRGVREELEKLSNETDFAIEAGLVGLWESSWFLVGLEQWLVSLSDNPDFVETLLDQTLLFLKQLHGNYLDIAGQYLDLVTLWDDYGTQSASLISPIMWRRLVKPRLAELISLIRSKTDAYIGIHSCGSIQALLDDLTEIGIQVINPVQVSAKNMNPNELKKRYGSRLTFWGGIDSHFLLPNGSPQEVKKAVINTINTMSVDGGYILSAVHNIQPGVPPENIISMYDTALTFSE